MPYPPNYGSRLNMINNAFTGANLNKDNSFPNCYCKKEYMNNSNFFVECENHKKCVNKWYHPYCIKELRGKSPEEIASIKSWRCPE